MKFIVPRDGFEPVTFQTSRMSLTEYGWDWVRSEMRKEKLPPIAGGSGQLASYAEQAVLNHLTGQDNASFANLSPVYLALCTTLPTSSSTGTTIVEATYTTYARTSLAASAWTAASGTAPASTPNSGVITGAACTASTSTIVGLGIVSALTLGNLIMWCSCASTVISSTQTPPTVAAGALTAGLT